ncbi:type I glyceraldehyde-3-phosphate dehydrogenase [Kineobactrum sediminis]|uniref:Glyceraldehyde-3-phosphate dehydrogenase n=1 Tax=Kineobactrum sediminis TaxID=1905677 RepID=A0A2N5XZA9_9GAMM|nr:type I glyceraldehyde-3-phosphate dehydrogenase [Kineobactrum sediminis]PLW81476.1 type I glyceraldehyde-3-phosphate dehydrogenase [Kineobactrum sediminis]
MARIAINGFGRIGRNIFRAWLEQTGSTQQIVAINDLGDPAMNAHLLKYDSVHGTLAQDVSLDGATIRVADKAIVCSQVRDLHALPWRDLEIDIVLECTGVFTTRASASGHLDAGAKLVLISAPANDADATVVFGVNESILDGSQKIVSNASCTTNCLAPLAKALHEGIGIETGLANTVHAYTNDQRLSDVAHSDVMRARSATQSLIPTKTGAAAAVALVLPALAGKLDGLAVRVPLINVSLLDLTFEASRKTTAEEVNRIIEDAAPGMRGALQVNQLPLVSIDFNHNPASSIADLSLTRVRGKLVKVLAWYDNEWGFSNRMLDTAGAMLALLPEQESNIPAATSFEPA